MEGDRLERAVDVTAVDGLGESVVVDVVGGVPEVRVPVAANSLRGAIREAVEEAPRRLRRELVRRDGEAL